MGSKPPKLERVASQGLAAGLEDRGLHAFRNRALISHYMGRGIRVCTGSNTSSRTPIAGVPLAVEAAYTLFNAL